MRWKVMGVLFVILILVISLCLIETFTITNFSMTPTFYPSQKITVLKNINFEIGKLKMRFNPFKIIRGDIYLINYIDDNTNNNNLIIKRCVGIIGDKLIFTDTSLFTISQKKNVFTLKEGKFMPCEMKNVSITGENTKSIDNEMFFFSGDNLKSSNDSRKFGLISRRQIYGKYLFKR